MTNDLERYKDAPDVPREWVFNASSPEPGALTVAVHEVTEGKSNHDRQSVRVDLTVKEMVRLLEVLNGALSYHLRMMT